MNFFNIYFNRITLYLLFLLVFVLSFIIYETTINFKNKTLKNKKFILKMVCCSVYVITTVTFYLMNTHSVLKEPSKYKDKTFNWFNMQELVVNYGILRDGDIIVKTRNKELINSAGHVYIFYNNHFISFNNIAKNQNLEVLTLKELYDTVFGIYNKTGKVDKFVILRLKNDTLNVEKQKENILKISKFNYFPLSLQQNTKSYNCATFVYRVMEMDEKVKPAKYKITMPYDFLTLKNLEVVPIKNKYNFDNTSVDFFEIFELINVFNKYNMKIEFNVNNNDIKLNDNSELFLNILENDTNSVEYDFDSFKTNK